MKNKIVTLVLGLFMTIGIVGCSKNGGNSSKPLVDIKRLTANLVDTEDANKKLLPLMADGGEVDDSSVNLDKQYIVIYKTERDIEFKVELENPEYSEITAIKFACEDPAAQVAVENSKGETTWNVIKDYPIVKWGGTDMYKRTFEIKLSEGFESDACALSVLDLQVNNEWQKKQLSNDVLDVYRMSESDLNWKFITNTTEYYEWEFETSEKVSNVRVYKVYEHSPSFDSEILPDEDGHYKVNSGCSLRYTWEFKVGNESVKWEGSKEIELLKIQRTRDILVDCYSLFVKITGTMTETIEELELYKKVDESLVYVLSLQYNDNSRWFTDDNYPNSLNSKFRNIDIYIKIFNRFYMV